MESEVRRKIKEYNMSEKTQKLKLFIAEGVLCDYTCGMVVIVAKDLERAKELARIELDDDQVVDNLIELSLTEESLNYMYGGS